MDRPWGLSADAAAARDGLHSIWGDHRSNPCGDATRRPSTTKRRGNSAGIAKHFHKRAIRDEPTAYQAVSSRCVHGSQLTGRSFANCGSTGVWQQPSSVRLLGLVSDDLV